MCPECKDTGIAYQRLIDSHGILYFILSYRPPSDYRSDVDWEIIPCPSCTSHQTQTPKT